MLRINQFRSLGIAVAAIALFVAPGARAQQPYDILYYGNSFTLGQGSSATVPSLVSDLAVAGGFPAPRSINASVGGQSWAWHLQFNSGPINSAIPAAENWDFAVLQDFSTMPTRLGNVAAHRSSGVALYQAIAARSPNVVPVLFETWARGFGHSFYAGANPSFPGGPPQMQAEVRNGYLLTQGDINAAHGSPIARLAPVGDAWENAGFPANFYDTDIYHAANRGTLTAALTIYAKIYNDPTTSDLNLTGVLTRLNLSPAVGAFITSIVDATLVPEPASGALAILALAAIHSRSRGKKSRPPRR